MNNEQTRRQFLGTVGAMATAAAVPGHLLATGEATPELRGELRTKIMTLGPLDAFLLIPGKPGEAVAWGLTLTESQEFRYYEFDGEVVGPAGLGPVVTDLHVDRLMLGSRDWAEWRASLEVAPARPIEMHVVPMNLFHVGFWVHRPTLVHVGGCVRSGGVVILHDVRFLLTGSVWPQPLGQS